MAKAEEEEDEKKKGLEAANDAGGMDSDPLRIRLKVPKVPPEEQGCPGGGHGSETMIAEEFKCRLCGKIFKSGKAVDGHMRVHPKRKRECVEEEEESRKPSLKCGLCGKAFPSRMSLYGRMRAHPGRTNRSVEGLFSGWSATGKRGRKRTSDGGIKDSLRFMAMNDKGDLKLSLSISDETEKRAGVEIKIKIPREENPSLDDVLDAAPAKKYACSWCRKSFAKFQSLGGHKSSCNKSRQSGTKQITAVVGQATVPWLNLPRLELSLSPPGSSSPSNLGETNSEPR